VNLVLYNFTSNLDAMALQDRSTVLDKEREKRDLAEYVMETKSIREEQRGT
jgi:hypothetical protein